MKKVALFAFILFLATTLTTPVYATVERSEHGPLARVGIVIGRGLANLAGSPLELPRSIVKEVKMHPRLWPITFIPRVLSNIFIRGTSAANDIAFFPWVAPFTDDIASWAEQMGLPEYPWQWEEDAV